MAKRRFKIEVNGDINNASKHQVIQNIPEVVGCLGDKFYYRMPMCWKYDDSKKNAPMGTARIHNGASQLDGCRRNALVLTADVAVFLCSTDSSNIVAFVRDGKAIVIPENAVNAICIERTKDTVTNIISIREYIRHNAINWEALENKYPIYDWNEIKVNAEYLFLIGGIA